MSAAGAPPSGESSAASASISFSKDIAPIFLQKCLTCHGPDKSKGAFQLHTFERLMKGGESKSPSITPGHPEQSKLFELITTNDADDRMPQKDDRLPQAQIAVIEGWIREGAKFDGPDTKALLLTLVPQTPHPDPPGNYPRPVPVLALAFSPDGKELAIGGYHEITLWNPADGKLLRRIKNVAQRTQCLAYNPPGTLLAAAGGSPGKSGEVKLFDPLNGSTVKLLGTTADMMLALSFSPDGARLAAGGADNAIRLYDVASGKPELLIEQHADWIMALAFHPDGTQLASGSRDKSARVFDSKTGELEHTYLGHGEPVFAVAFSDDGKQICSAGRDRKIHLWAPKDAKKLDEIGGFEDEVYKLIVEGDSIFSCSGDKNVRQHKLGKKAELVRTFSGHTDVVYSMAFHPQSQRLATGSFDGEVRIWSTVDGKLLAQFIASPGHLAAK